MCQFSPDILVETEAVASISDAHGGRMLILGKNGARFSLSPREREKREVERCIAIPVHEIESGSVSARAD